MLLLIDFLEQILIQISALINSSQHLYKMSFTSNLIAQYIKAFPRIENLAERITKSNNFIANYPISLQPTLSNRLTLFSQHKIKKDNDIFLMAASECIFSTELRGANYSQQRQIFQQIQTLSAQYEVFNVDFMQRMKIYIQLMGNTQKLKLGDMPMKQYAQYVLEGQQTGIPKTEINSKFLYELYLSWQRSNRITFDYLSKQLFKRSEYSQFTNACNKGKSIIRNAGNSPYKFCAPFLDKMDHSFDPNCQFDVMYMPHRRSPFIRIRTIKDIEAGQKATICYGNLNNYQLLLRYGFIASENPNKLFMLPLNFQQIIQIFNKNIDWKHSQFMKRGIKLKNYIKILSNGKISNDDLTMMRILINDSQNPTELDVDSDKHDNLIYSFIGEHAIGMRRNIKINNLKISTDRHIQRLEQEQINILQHFLSSNKSKN